MRFADPDRSAISNRGPMGRPPIADLGQEIGHPTMDRRPGANRLLWIAAMERPLLLITGLTANRFVVREPAGLPAELDCGHGGGEPANVNRGHWSGPLPCIAGRERPATMDRGHRTGPLFGLSTRVRPATVDHGL